MNYVDIFLIVIFILAGLQGFYRGFILELFSLLAFFFGVLAAVRYSRPIALWIVGDSDWLGLVKIIVFVLLFLVLSLIINSIAKILKNVVQKIFLGWIDKLFGIALGVLKWGFLMSMVVWMLMAGGFQLPSRDLSQSLIFPHIAHLAPGAVRIFDDIFPFLDGILDWGEDFGGGQKFV